MARENDSKINSLFIFILSDQAIQRISGEWCDKVMTGPEKYLEINTLLKNSLRGKN